ncbi:MAG: hypothetical protein OXC10_14545 [Rhodospirillaceae bacterium]|nr:hypothetical protein [Rhodospirillaceae bacterium]
MTIIRVTSTPTRLADGLGITADALAKTDFVLLWVGIIENAGPVSVRVVRAAAAPDPLTVMGSRMTRYERRRFREYPAAVGPGAGPWWFWTTRASDVATLLVEPEVQ